MIWQLALLGVAEAAVLLLRCRSAVEPGALRSAWWTFCTFAVHALDDQHEASRQRNDARLALTSRDRKPAPRPKRTHGDGRSGG